MKTPGLRENRVTTLLTPAGNQEWESNKNGEDSSNPRVISSLFISNVMLYIAINRKVIKSLKRGDEPFRHAGGSSEMPACGGERSVCMYMHGQLYSHQAAQGSFSGLFIYFMAGCLLCKRKS